MKKPILLFALTLIAGGALASCNLGLRSSSSSESIPSQITPSEVFQMQAVTGLSMVNTPSIPSSKAVLRARENMSQDEIAAIQEALPTIDLLLDNESNFVSDVQIVNAEVDGVTYRYEESIRYWNNEYQEASYRLLYNIDGEIVETPTETSSENVSSESELAPSDPKARHDEDHDDDHDEDKGNHEEEKPSHNDLDEEFKSTSSLTGIAYLDETTYVPFYSKVETETEEDETETERHFVLKTGENSLISIQEEFESDGSEKEHDLRYRVVENGIVTTHYKISIEQEDNQDEIHLKTNGYKYSVKRTSSEEGAFYRVSIKGQGDKLVATFHKETDEEGNVSYNVI